MPQWSVIIPTYNRAKLLSAALASLPADAPGGLEIIVVDDGSQDETAGVVAQCGRPVRFLQQRQAGPGAARNLGWNHASGVYVLFLDSDDFWFPWTLPTVAACFSRHPEARFLIGSGRPFRHSEDLVEARPTPLETDWYPDYLASSAKFIWIGASALAVRRDCAARFEAARMNAEDIDLALHLGTEPGFVHLRQPVTFAYRQHEVSLVADSRLTEAGALHLLEEEAAGRYGGGSARAPARRALIGRVVRPLALQALGRGNWHCAWSLYRRSLRYHLELGRWRFLTLFWLLALQAWVVRLAHLPAFSRKPERGN